MRDQNMPTKQMLLDFYCTKEFCFSERQKELERDRERKRQTERDRERQRDRETERQRQTETDRETERQRDREKPKLTILKSTTIRHHLMHNLTLEALQTKVQTFDSQQIQ